MLPFQSSYMNNLLESLTAGIVIINTRGSIYAVNQAACDMLGYQREDLLRADPRDELKPRVDNQVAFSALIETAIREQKAGRSLNLRYTQPEGQELFLSLSTSLLIEYDKVFGILLQFSDQTEIFALHQHEKEMLQAQSRLQAERISGLHKLAVAIAHQIRNPLMTIGGFAQHLLKKKDADDPERKHLSHILDGVHRLEEIVQAVGEFTDLAEIHRSRVAVGEILNQVRQTAEEEAAALGREASIVIEDHDGVAALDPHLIHVGLAEVVKNAVEALPETDGEIIISAHRHSDRIEFTISDNGDGIAPGDIPYVFDPFFTNKAVGVGMGLAKARAVFDELGGGITLEPRDSGGVTVTAWVSLATDDDPIADTRPANLK